MAPVLRRPREIDNQLRLLPKLKPNEARLIFIPLVAHEHSSSSLSHIRKQSMRFPALFIKRLTRYNFRLRLNMTVSWVGGGHSRNISIYQLPPPTLGGGSCHLPPVIKETAILNSRPTFNWSNHIVLSFPVAPFLLSDLLRIFFSFKNIKNGRRKEQASDKGRQEGSEEEDRRLLHPQGVVRCPSPRHVQHQGRVQDACQQDRR